MGVVLAHQSYGKSRVRLTKVTRRPDRHELRELVIDIALEGEFAASYVSGDSRLVIATDTMKNTVYALAAEHPVDEPEAFGALLARHFIDGVDEQDFSFARLGLGRPADDHARLHR